jgi:GNAT superfamily N-acetyltransferase
MQNSAVELTMENGTSYRIQACVEPGTRHTKEFLKSQIACAIEGMSGKSLRQRFASSVNKLSEKQLDYLTSLDGKDKVAWCASIGSDKAERGIGIARYVKLPNEENVAEFAVTVVDEFQRQGIGYELLKKLIELAGNNGIKILRGYVLSGNEHMLSLCRRLGAHTYSEDWSFVIADIPVPDFAAVD